MANHSHSTHRSRTPPAPLLPPRGRLGGRKYNRGATASISIDISCPRKGDSTIHVVDLHSSRDDATHTLRPAARPVYTHKGRCGGGRSITEWDVGATDRQEGGRRKTRGGIVPED